MKSVFRVKHRARAKLVGVRGLVDAGEYAETVLAKSLEAAIEKLRVHVLSQRYTAGPEDSPQGEGDIVRCDIESVEKVCDIDVP